MPCHRRWRTAGAVVPPGRWSARTRRSSLPSRPRREPGRGVASRFGVMTRGRAAATPAALIVTLGLAAASWMVAVRLMSGMDMGVATRLGSFGFFVVLWVLMMAAMMLPGAVPAVVRRAHASGQVRAVPLFVGSYRAVWTLVGLAVFAV